MFKFIYFYIYQIKTLSINYEIFKNYIYYFFIYLLFYLYFIFYFKYSINVKYPQFVTIYFP
jgi:hypothetical protein